MDKIIIHNHITDLSYGITLAEVGYHLYQGTYEELNGLPTKYQVDGHPLIVRPNDKSVTITVKEKK